TASRALLILFSMLPLQSKTTPKEIGASSEVKWRMVCSTLSSYSLNDGFSSPVTKRSKWSVTVTGISTRFEFTRMFAEVPSAESRVRTRGSMETRVSRDPLGPSEKAKPEHARRMQAAAGAVAPEREYAYPIVCLIFNSPLCQGCAGGPQVAFFRHLSGAGHRERLLCGVSWWR